MSEKSSFQAGIDFESVLRIISKQIYETPMAFIRENVQNAVDAVRIQAHRDNADPKDAQYRIDISTDDKRVIVKDNGTGMSEDDLKNYFWTIGASGKRTAEAFAAGCVGTFGIGGFANFGVCEKLEVISQKKDTPEGTLTHLSEAEIKSAGAAIPSITAESSNAAAPRGTVVIGHLRSTPNISELGQYLKEFVKFVPISVFFNGEKISQTPFSTIDSRENLTPIGGLREWVDGDLKIVGRLYEDKGHTIVSAIDSLIINGETINFVGQLRFENGAIDTFKRGFKLCSSAIGTTIGVSGRLDCDRFVPTAGRDSLDNNTTILLNRIVLCMERAVIDVVLESSERIAQHTRIFRYITRTNQVAKLGMARVHLADGTESTLSNIRSKATQGGVGVFFGVSQKQALNQIMQARGHIVVLLSSDANRQAAERSYLEQFCTAKAFDGMIDCIEHYTNPSRFELIFLSELELNISKSYEIRNFKLTAGKLTEDIPVFVKENTASQSLEIFVDTNIPR